MSVFGKSGTIVVPTYTIKWQMEKIYIRTNKKPYGIFAEHIRNKKMFKKRHQ